MAKKLQKLALPALLAVLCTAVNAQSDWQSRKDRENAAASASSITRNGGRWDEKAERDRRYRQTAPRFTAHLSGCGPASCTDEFGNTYSPSGSVLIRQDGYACNRIGSLVECD
ncbi:hypothetical protein [Acidovorax phage AP1]|nr:hypothetical protein [Acidovorax phage AP1]